MSFIKPRSILPASLIVLFAVLVACGGGPADVPTENSSTSFGLSNPAANVKESQAPSFTVSTGGGNTFSLDDHPDEVVILYFSFPG